MLYVGNDVVDLRDPWNCGKSGDRPFLNRVFMPNEQRLIEGAPRPDRMLWALWAAKEAAYKVAVKILPDVSAVPRHYPVFIEELHDTAGRNDAEVLAGHVDAPGGAVGIRLFLEGPWVHCVGVAGAFPANPLVCHRVLTLPAGGDPSLLVRTGLREDLSACLGLQAGGMDVRRSRGPRGLLPPRIYWEGRPMEWDISLSHDGAYGAYAFVSPKAAGPPERHSTQTSQRPTGRN